LILLELLPARMMELVDMPDLGSDVNIHCSAIIL